MTDGGPLSLPPLPVTGAWRPGDPAGRRKFFTLPQDRPFALEGGGSLDEIVVAYETWGSLDDDASNAILICHAWTGDSHVAGPSDARPCRARLVGRHGRPRSADRHRALLRRVPQRARRVPGLDGPVVDRARRPAAPTARGSPSSPSATWCGCRPRSRDHLGIEQWLSVVGGSMGGMQVLEWGVTYPSAVRSLAPDRHVRAGDGAADRARQRRSPRRSASTRSGGAATTTTPRPATGRTRVSRSRDSSPRSRSAPTTCSPTASGARSPTSQPGFSLWQRFEVERYLDYHGDKLVRRFDANSYLVIGKAMDLQDIGRGRGGLEAAMERIRVPVRTIGIRSRHALPDVPAEADPRRAPLHREVGASTSRSTAPHGHDAFLIDLDQVGDAVTDIPRRHAEGAPAVTAEDPPVAARHRSRSGRAATKRTPRSRRRCGRRARS